MQKHQILVSSVSCPGPLIEGKWQGGCGKLMTLKKTNDSRDVFQWRCRRVHTVHKAKMQYKVKDVKLMLQLLANRFQVTTGKYIRINLFMVTGIYTFRGDA